MKKRKKQKKTFKKRSKQRSFKKRKKIKMVIEKRLFSNTEDLLPVISFGSKSSKEDKEKHNDFIKRMKERGYTKKQVELAVSWWVRHRKRQ